jgi:hypothetical protein
MSNEKPLKISDNAKDIIIETEDALVRLYEITVNVLNEGIKVGKNQPMTGLLAFMMFVDLLHGGAYKGKIQDLPYYNGTSAQEMGITFPDGATPEQKEAIMNANAPRIFPKLISDQVYFLYKEYVAKIFITENVGGLVTTNLRTLVEGGTAIGKSELELQGKLAKLAASGTQDLEEQLTG